MAAPIHRSSGFEDSGFIFMADILAPDDGEAIQQADLSSISYKVFNESNVEVATGSLSISGVIYDSYVTGDARWDQGGNGYNFLWAPPVTTVPAAGEYTFEVLFTPVLGQQFYGVWERSISEILTDN